MAILTKEEILGILRKLGISSASELDSYLKEYSEYLTLQDIRDLPQEYRRKIKYSYPTRYSSAGRSARISNSLRSSADPGSFCKKRLQ